MDVTAKIRAAQNRLEKTCDPGKTPGRVRCQGCGKELKPEDGKSGVEYVKTKRGSEIFFHTGCMGQVWKSRIR